jgi:cysteine-rich repeat protein
VTGPALRSCVVSLGLALGASVAGCSGLDQDLPEASESAAELSAPLLLATEIDSERSLLVTDVQILQQFALRDVLSQLLRDAGDSRTPQALLLDWLATRPDANRLDEIAETQADATLAHYAPIALSNRFDLADPAGSNCGEYRVAFFDDLTVDGSFLIFEARLPNPNPGLGLEGCRPVAELWANLSRENDVAARAQTLRAFYFSGLSGFAPAIHANHYRGAHNQSGQIRVNARDDSFGNWTFSEFHTVLGANRVSLARASTRDNPVDSHAGDPAGNPLAQLFQSSVVSSIPSTPGSGLLATTFSTLAVTLPPSVDDTVDRGRTRSGNDELIEAASPSFKQAIASRLTSVGSSLTADQVVARVQALTCVGCHDLQSDLGGPLSKNPSATFHNLEFLSASLDATTNRFSVKPELADRFLPERREILSTFLGLRRECRTQSLVALPGVVASSSSDESPSLVAIKAIDGNASTRWSSLFADPQWLEVDLRLRRKLRRVVLRWEAAASSNYDIQVRDSFAEPWRTIFNQPSGDGGVDVIDGLDEPARFVRVFSRARTTPWGVSLFELELFGDPDRLCTVCGNGTLQAGEQCDDGNLLAGDACDASCRSTIPVGRSIASALQAEDNDGMQGLQFESTADAGAGLNAGWIDSGDFVEWAVNVPVAGNYSLTTRSATWSNATLQIRVDGLVKTSLALNSTWNGSGSQYQTWSSFATAPFALSAGSHRLRVAFTSGGQNLNWVKLAATP